MKNLFALILLISTSFAASSQQYGWVDLSQNIPTQGANLLTDIFFVDENEGWVTSSSQFEIYHTTDGGLTFEVQTTLQPTNAIYMLDKNRGYSGGQSGTVFYTNNGGDTWNLINNSLPSTIRGMVFPPDSDTGFICGDNGWVGKIDSTHVFDMEKLVYANLYAINFPAKSEGWVCGGSIIRNYIDGEWTAEFLATGGYYTAMHFCDASNGWIGGDGGQLIHTSNGYNFETQRPYGSGATLNDIYAINPMDAWAVDYHHIISTNDSGNTWTLDSVPLGGSGTLVSVFYLNKNLGYVSGYKQDDELNSLPALFKYMVISGTEEEQQNNLNIEVFPNPARNKFEVRSLEFGVEDTRIELYDLSGRKLLEKNMPKGTESMEIDVSSMGSGVYFIQIQAGNKTVTKKLIIQK